MLCGLLLYWIHPTSRWVLQLDLAELREPRDPHRTLQFDFVELEYAFLAQPVVYAPPIRLFRTTEQFV